MHRLLLVGLGSLLLAGACTFHSTATQWNGRVGPDGRPVHMVTTTSYGVHLFVLMPLAGDTRAEALVEAATARIATSDSDRVRVVETESANYWYALPPITWFVSPVMGSVSIEYVPSAKALQAAAELERLQAERAAVRNQQDHSHVIPEPRRR